MKKTNLYTWKEKIATMGFIVINILLFITSMFSGDILYEQGAFSLRYILQGREWWRLITSMFLHADADHLAGNMLILYLAGELVEKYIGKWRYTILYFFSGAAGAVLYAVYEYYTGNYTDTIGASGAVFGVLGALFVIVVCHKGRYENISAGRMTFMMVCMAYMGLRSSNVNNAAHMGGLLGGILLAGFYMLIRKPENGREII